MNLPVDYTAIDPATRRAVREEYIKRQDGKCWHCGSSLRGPAAEEILSKPVNSKLFPPNFFKWPVHLHHDHDTGLTIGAVHCRCNAVLWQYHGE